MVLENNIEPIIRKLIISELQNLKQGILKIESQCDTLEGKIRALDKKLETVNDALQGDMLTFQKS